MTQASIPRRAFVQRAAILAGGLVIGIPLSVTGIAGCAAPAASRALGPWLRIGADGSVTIFSNATEIGQGSASALAQILAEELEVGWSAVQVEYAPVDTGHFNPELGTYQTGGSTAVSAMFDLMRRAGATARVMLIDAGARRWQVPPSECTAANGCVTHPRSGRSLPYSELVESAARLPPPKEVALKPPGAWKLIGQSLPRLDTPGKVDGSAIYGIDIKVPGMLIAAIAQCPVFGGRLRSLDEAPARALPGVRNVVRLDNAVAILASNYCTARKGLAALQPVWDEGTAATLTSAALSQQLHQAITLPGIPVAPKDRDAGQIRSANDRALASAARVLEATYEAPLLAHATLEPMNATAKVGHGVAELWVPTQVQMQMRRDVAAALGLEPAAVTVHTTQVGGGFGRRLETDYGVQAARIAQRAGAPVKLLWSREEDMQHDFYRPAAVARLRAALSADGKLLALRADTAAVNDSEPLGGLTDVPYEIPNYLVTWSRVPSPVTIGAWRSVDHSQNAFFFESFLDELAHALGTDPLTLRCRMLAANPRALRVITLAAERSGWHTKPPAGRHRGLALVVRGKTSVAEVVEISVSESKALRVHRVTCAVDCGVAVNPGNVRAQFEGGVLFALSAALAGKITLNNGRVEQTNFDGYPVLEISAAPHIDVHIVNTPTEGVAPSGCGEPPVPPVAPALANAIFTATGQRLRALPVRDAGFTVS
jgi:isoquinoline 1-oxidoreductase subunit beta